MKENEVGKSFNLIPAGVGFSKHLPRQGELDNESRSPRQYGDRGRLRGSLRGLGPGLCPCPVQVELQLLPDGRQRGLSVEGWTGR